MPRSTARELALALIAARLAPPDGNLPDPLTPPTEGADPAANHWRNYAEYLRRGAPDGIAGEGDPFTWDGSRLRNWTELDPAAACAAILDMPAGAERGAAVDEAAEAMSRTDPQGAWEFVLAAGEKFPGRGTARAWLRFIGERSSRESPELTRGLSPTQQECLAAALTSWVKGGWDVASVSNSMAADEELPDIVIGSQALADSPARRDLAEALAERNYAALLSGSGGVSVSDPNRSPEHAALTTHGLLAMLDPDYSPGLPWLMELGNGGPGGAGNSALLTTAAPRLLPEMARAGHVREAVELYHRIDDPGVRQAALEGLLPAWMDDDPQAARAAFEAASFTALERERWERHPAFLLHREPR
jgi:hypothetical protein